MQCTVGSWGKGDEEEPLRRWQLSLNVPPDLCTMHEATGCAEEARAPRVAAMVVLAAFCAALVLPCSTTSTRSVRPFAARNQRSKIPFPRSLTSRCNFVNLGFNAAC